VVLVAATVEDHGGDARVPRPLGDQRADKLGLGRLVAVRRPDGLVQGGRRCEGAADGVGYGKAKEVPAAIAKGVEEAKKHFFRVPRIVGTIPHTVQGEAAAGVVLLKPASPGKIN